MKKLIMVLMVALLPLMSFGQEVSKVNHLYVDNIELVEYSDSSYYLMFKNSKWNYVIEFEGISFSTKDELISFVTELSLSKSKYVPLKSDDGENGLEPKTTFKKLLKKLTEVNS